MIFVAEPIISWYTKSHIRNEYSENQTDPATFPHSTTRFDMVSPSKTVVEKTLLRQGMFKSFKKNTTDQAVEP